MSAKQFLLLASLLVTTNQCSSQFLHNTPLYKLNILTFKDYKMEESKNITLSNCQIRSVEKNTFSKMVRLLSLHLNYNELSSLPDNVFDSNVKLDFLTLASNRLHSLPPNIFSKLTLLTELSLYKNNIKYLDANIFSNLRSLTKLWINFNGLTKLDDNLFRNNINLIYLNVGDNFIDTLNENIFNNMPKLESLLLDKNKVNYLPINIFSRLPNLKTLSMISNELSDLDSRIFDNNKKLENVWLGSNKLTSLKTGLFKNAVHLRYLNVENNQIEIIELNVFAINSILQHWHLAENSLTTIDFNIITNLKYLSILTLGSNPWLCDCDLKVLYEKWRNLYLKTSPACSNPPNLKDRLWSNLNSNDFKCTNKLEIINSKLDINGNKATIGCQIDSTADVEKISWKLSDNTLVSDHFKTLNKPYKICQSTSADGSTWHNLIIDDLKTGDSGKYKCSFGDKYSNTEKEENLIVSPEHLQTFMKPSLLLSLNNDIKLFADFGESVTAGCQIYSRSGHKPNMVWSFNNQPIDAGLRYKITEGNIDDRLAWYNLTITSVRDGDNGVYACQANGYNDANKFTLKVNKKLNTYIPGWTDYE